MVVPTFAPTIIPNDWSNEMIPAATRPDVITIVAVEDWIIAVIIIPTKNALTALSVSFPITIFSVPDELSFRLLPISLIPYRNRANPPNNEIALKISIFYSSFTF